jgi:uncharacterized membrane protein
VDGENHLAAVPTAGYGVIPLLAGIAYYILERQIIAAQGKNSRLAVAVGSGLEGRISPALYAVGIPLAFVSPWISTALYVAVALLWLVPDSRIERELHKTA